MKDYLSQSFINLNQTAIKVLGVFAFLFCMSFSGYGQDGLINPTDAINKLRSEAKEASLIGEPERFDFAKQYKDSSKDVVRALFIKRYYQYLVKNQADGNSTRDGLVVTEERMNATLGALPGMDSLVEDVRSDLEIELTN